MRDSHTILKAAKKLVAVGEQTSALCMLRDGFDADTEFAVLARAVKWASSVNWTGELRPIRVAWLGSGTLEHCRDFIAFWALMDGLRIESYLPPYDTWRMEILNPDSELYSFRPDIVWLYTHWRDVRLATDATLSVDAAETLALETAESFFTIWRILAERLPGTQIVQNTFDPPPCEAFGNYAIMLPGSTANLSRRINFALTQRASATGVGLFNYEWLAMQCGLNRWHSPSYWFHSKHPFAPELTGWAAYYCARFLASLRGTSKKALVLDLDNTLWGGIIGDDGLEGIQLGVGADGEAFTAFQEYVRELAARGVVLTVVSKNEEAAAKEPFLKHPDMRLKLEDIAVFTANWGNKADNIRNIAATLSLGLDAFVFVDDNPVERELVRRELSMVAVPEMSSEPSEYVRTLEKRAYFETSSYSVEDARRGRMYCENAGRSEARKTSANLDEYLESLEMKADCGSADEFHIPRMAQLVNKSNQFNLTGARCTEAALWELARREDHIVRWFSLRDRFGDYGLVAVLILRRNEEAFVVDAWNMSCRVLGRTMEEYILNDSIRLISTHGGVYLIGAYIPTGKNAMVANLYGRLGFNKIEGDSAPGLFWSLDIREAGSQRQTRIQTCNSLKL